MWKMRLGRMMICCCILALSACAGMEAPGPAKPAATVSPPAPPATPALRRKAPAAEAAGRPAPAPDQSAYDPRDDTDGNVYFSSGDTKVNERGQEVLRRHASRLKENPHQVVTLVGYTDPLGSASYNLAVAEERMDSVLEVLRSLGVPRGQIRRVSAGQSQAGAGDCNNPVCRQQMRRVELIYEK